MATSSFISINIHFVFSTKNRKNLIDSKFKSHLWAYMGGIAKENKMIALAVGGTEYVGFLYDSGIEYEERFIWG